MLPEITVLPFPMADTNKVNASAKTMELQAQRMQVLTDLARKKPVLVIALPEEAAQRLPAPERITGKSLVLEKEQDFERDSLLEELVAMGYERVSQVEQRGQFSVRGDILDIYTSNEEEPVRVEFLVILLIRCGNLLLIHNDPLRILIRVVCIPLLLARIQRVRTIRHYCSIWMVVLSYGMSRIV